MSRIFVIVEHRQGKLREITLEMLGKANELCRQGSHELTAVLLSGGDDDFMDDLLTRAERVVAVQDERLSQFNSDDYRAILASLISEERPVLTLLGHTPWGMDLAPALAVQMGYPLATDCVGVEWEGDHPTVVRNVYNGKLFSRVSFQESAGYLATVRPGAFTADVPPGEKGDLAVRKVDTDLPEPRKEFREFVDTGAGAVDITQADLLVSVGRGIGEPDNIAAVQELAELVGGVLSCSRPVVDKNWLPKYHQVGTSGKSVKPKIYLALGISGAFQHVAGISGAGTVLAVNKDKKAPIFRVADFGVVEDLFVVVQALKEKLKGK
jgi:electron transfer flavoprotein alpha subunit